MRIAFALLILGLWPHDLHAQAFIASRAHPEFGIGPLFVSVTVGKDDVRPAHRPVTVTVTWNLVLPEHRAAKDMAQDLYLLWPGEVPGAGGDERADPRLLAQVDALGFLAVLVAFTFEAGRARASLAGAAAARAPPHHGRAVRHGLPLRGLAHARAAARDAGDPARSGRLGPAARITSTSVQACFAPRRGLADPRSSSGFFGARLGDDGYSRGPLS